MTLSKGIRTRKVQRTYTTAIALLRTSKEDGDTKKGIEAQRDFIADYASRKGITIVAEYIEDGVSGATPLDLRERLQDALQAIKDGVADILLTYDITRVARDIGIFGTIRSTLQKMNAKGLTSYGDEYTNPADDFSSFKAVFGEYERKTIANRLHSGRRVRSKKDGMGSGYLPFGYTRTPDGSITVDASAIPVIQMVYSCRVVQRLSYSKTIEALNAAGYNTPKGGTWGNSTVQQIEKNLPLYTTGKRTWADVEASEAWPTLITPE